MAQVISLQAMQDLAYFFATHTQQLMSEETYVKATGRWEEDLRKEYGIGERIRVSPESLHVDFDIIARDGSVPGTQSAETWIHLWEVMMSHPEVMQNFDAVRIFKHIARELGAKNVHDFVRSPEGGVQADIRPDEEVEQEVQRGNLQAVQ